MSIGERLKEWRAARNIGQKEASAIFGVSYSVYQKYELGSSVPGGDAIGAFVRAGINSNWLLTGEGEMLLMSTQGHVESEVYNEDTKGTLDDFALVPVYDVQASAGHGSHVESELQTGQLAFKKSWLKEKGLQVGHLAIITAKGDSMEPTICDRGVLLVDTRVDKIIDDSIYIVQADHNLIVKRLQQAFDGSVSIISDNPRYEKQRLDPEQAKTLKIAGRVCWYGHEI